MGNIILVNGNHEKIPNISENLETDLSYISGNRNPEKLFIFQEVSFRARKMKKIPLLKCFLYFGKCSFLTSSLKNFLYFRKEFARLENQKFLILIFKHQRKRKKFLILFLKRKHN